MSQSLPRVAVIGAGSSGITALKTLAEQGFDVTCYEASDRVGGNWVYENSNGMSACYRDLHINTSRLRMEYSDYPMPESYPDYPRHDQIATYFDDYVEHFGVRDRIRFETRVEHVGREADGTWTISASDGTTERYDALLVANGHHWDARWPEPSFPGSDSFTGEQMHAHEYMNPDGLHDKDVVVLGMGNSAMDIAVESSYVAAEHVPRGAPRRLDHPQVHLRAADGPAEERPAHPVQGAPEVHPQPREAVRGRPGEVRPAQARPPVRRGAPDGLRAHPRPDHPRRGEGEAEHPPPRRRHGRVRGRDARARRRRRLLHGLQDQLPVLRRGLPRGAATTASSCTAASSTPSCRTSSSSACSSRSAP